ncbi:transcriptional regulator [candidate division WWE3 bacterium CG06_land_8_20_14_3_00_42_16]|uniref:Transcriptional regulator n=3 Tax=Katanobacteria TaxID=422282 RepID=A0A2M7ANI4_UNCKA|nr:MAG: transcriptional regulator [candidate division WWE3 bacterium CG06_land_8_20_14_3_00_42_16]PJA38255.1 MAG: transcriptional regulator [candidate division WWE3 bacterium CG_4_9_14_3_um_filter_43_9]PJC68749.1 MAG: transcriptional regulator [candidate division WWE3 bacterium CG_4_8_14_3_um_filter_42_11]
MKSMTKENYTQILSRLSKIEGQVRGVKSMIEKERDFTEVLTQLSAIKSGINQVALQLMFQQKEFREQENERVRKALSKFI